MERKRGVEWYAGIALGVMIGLSLAFALFFAVDYVRSQGYKLADDEWFGFAINAITIIASAFAATAAFWGIKHQIQHKIDMEEYHRQERLAASLALLPVVLLKINQMGIQILRRIAYGAEYADQNAPTNISQEDIVILKDIIGASRGDARTDLQNLLAIYQIALHLFQEFP
jgi:hypothetical protein